MWPLEPEAVPTQISPFCEMMMWLEPTVPLKLYRDIAARVEDALKNLKQLKGLFLDNNQITELKPLMGLRGLQKLGLSSNHNLTRESVRRLEKVLNRCKVYSNAK